MFLGTLDKVYFVDKTERNPAQIAGHPAWAAEYSISSNSGRAMDVVTNSFCAVSIYLCLRFRLVHGAFRLIREEAF